ncbi:MAG: hypothetical protein QNK44_07895 [Hyphomicrobiaceae bacterium]|nr:hypothetical protein [Hyphomicrobiaceae bacterium]
MRYLIAPLILLIVACTTPAQDGLVVCRAYDSSLRALAGYRAADRLSIEQVATVDRWRPVLNEACSGPVSASTLSVIEQGVFAMIAIEEAVQ